MGNYSVTAIFTKEPAVISGALRSVIYVLILLGVFQLTVEQLAGIALGLELVLGLFVRSQSTSSTSPTLAVGTPVNAGAAVVASVVPPPEPVAIAGDPPIAGGG